MSVQFMLSYLREYTNRGKKIACMPVKTDAIAKITATYLNIDTIMM